MRGEKMSGEERKGEERGHTLIRYQTLTLPKPLVEFGNKRMILHQVEALAAAGVTDIVLAVNYRPEIMEKYLAEVYIPILYYFIYGCEGAFSDDGNSTSRNTTSRSPSPLRANLSAPQAR